MKHAAIFFADVFSFINVGDVLFQGICSPTKNDPNFMPWKPDRDPHQENFKQLIPMFLQKESRLYQQINLRQVTKSYDLFVKMFPAVSCPHQSANQP